MFIGYPPFQWVFDILHRFAQVSVNLTCPRSNNFSYRDVREGSKAIIVVIVAVTILRNCS